MKRILLVAGEPSGDRHGAALAHALRQRPELEGVALEGVAGPLMREAGVTALVPMEQLAVVGIVEVLAHLPAILSARSVLQKKLRDKDTRLVIPIDYPGFNLPLAAYAHRLRVPVLYYIAPQVWAWHPERAREMARWVDRLAVVFPFEEPLFRDAGVPTRWVGHPLLDGFAPEVDEAAWRATLGIAPGARVLGLLPGSRAGEIERHQGVLLAAAEILRSERPDLAAVVALPPRTTGGAPEIERTGNGIAVRGLTRATQAFATACAVASGTATLETALFGTPLAVIFRTGRLNWELGRRLVKLRRIGLPNIVAGEDVAPELLQDDFTPQNLAGTLAPWLDDPARRAAQKETLARVRAKLGGPGASDRAAEWLREMVE